MRSFARQALAFVGSLVALAAIVTGLAAGLRLLLRYTFHGVSPTVEAAIVAAAATGILSVLSILLQRQYERRQQLEQVIRQRKTEIYESVVNSFFDIFGLGKDRTEEQSQEAIAEAVIRLAELTPHLGSWASDSVLISWSRYRRVMAAQGSPLDSILGFERVLLEIRRDLGHPNKDVKQGDLLGLWINDIDEILAARAVRDAV